MKKALIITNLMWLCVFTFMAFKPDSAPADDCDNIVANYKSEKFTGLNAKSASEMASLYKQNHLKALLGGRDARTIWFSLNTLKKFIWQIEHYNCMKPKLKIADENLGIRIYYGEYPVASQLKENKIWSGVNPSFQNLHTAFLVPTYWDGSLNRDFDPKLDYNKGSKSGDWSAMPLSRYLNNNTANLGNITITGVSLINNNETTAKNHGGLCPPLCNDQDLAF